MSFIIKKHIFIYGVLSFFALSLQAGTSMEIPESDGPVPVKMAVFIVDIDDIDAAEQNFTANVYYKVSWTDKRLSKDLKKKDILPLNDVWNPRIQVVNQQKIWPTLPEIVEVHPDGKVIYRQRVWGQFSQPLNLLDFPFDEQVFDVMMVAVGFEPDEIKITRDEKTPSGIAEKLSQADWKIVDWQAKNQPYSPLGESRTEGFVLTFRAKRKIGYYVMKIIIPLILIVMMSWVVFWIDPKDAGTQVGVAVTSMLTLIAYRFATDALLPKVSYITRLDYFILGSTILIFSGLIEVLITTTLAKKEKLPTARMIDRFARWSMPILFLAVTLKAFVF